ncbi:hypothetical protein ACIODS_11690 [Micromonospora chalcea]|uniref:hypothetical protein n=1 Tax=Micromonospora chalcea TaxID=1874 RepID=UPI00382F7898
MPTEHTQTSTRTRLLWTLGLATAAAGITLALDSRPAHAHDTRPDTPILNSVGQLADNTVRNVVGQPAATITPTGDSKPRPVRNLIVHTTKTVDTAVSDATGTVRAVTDTADRATKPLPVVGGTVDKVTDLTDHITSTLPALTPPATVNAAPTPTRPAQPAPGGSDDTDRGGTPNPVSGGGLGGSESEGGDAPGAAPIPHDQAAAPGAHHPTISHTPGTHPGAARNRGNDVNFTPAPAHTTSPSKPTTPTSRSECDSLAGTLNATAGSDTQPSTPAHWAHHPPTHHSHATAHTANTTNRPTKPAAPPG